MKTIGFQTKLCKPRHPFTKGKVERLVRFVKGNFLVDRSFLDITDLNQSALDWCNRQNAVYHRATDCVPQQVHETDCSKRAASFLETQDIFRYLCPLRKISFDGFVNYEGRRFGVPYRYTGSPDSQPADFICGLCPQEYSVYWSGRYRENPSGQSVWL